MGAPHDEPGGPDAPVLPDRERGAPRAQKPMPRWRTALFPKVAGLLAGLLRIYWASLRLRVHGEEHLEPLLARGERFIPCIWHHLLLYCVHVPITIWKLDIFNDKCM